MFGHRQSLARARYLEQMKAVDAQTWLSCRRLQLGRRDRAFPGALEVPLLASDKVRDRMMLKYRTTQIWVPLVPEQVAT
jgi:hypothetical protein